MKWDDLRYFLAVARDGTMLGAATRLGVSQALLSRHIAALEAAVDARLLERTTRGCTLTRDGTEVFVAAERMEAEMLAGIARLEGHSQISGTIRIGAPDGFGSAFLAPRLGRFQSTYPGLRIQLVPVPRSFSLSEREADLAVMVGRPAKGRLRRRKLVDYSLGLYASADYLSRHPAPQTIDDLSGHAKIGYVEDLIYTPDLNFTAEVAENWTSDIEIATAIGQFEAIRGGIGIGFCHDFMAAACPNVIQVLPDLIIERSYWLVSHENLAAEKRVSVVADLLEDLVRQERGIFSRR